MSTLASDVMDQAAAILNDTALSLYTYVAQTPYLKKANEELEKKLIIYGISVQRKVNSTPIQIAAYANTVTLPSDFLFPINLFERASGSSDPWTIMIEKSWEPESIVISDILIYWAFRDNAIHLIGANTDREVMIEYERMLSVISSSSSPIDFYLAKNYLAARTAELCARYIGQNKELADDIKRTETDIAEDDLMRAYVLNLQGIPQRRIPFNRQTRRLA